MRLKTYQYRAINTAGTLIEGRSAATSKSALHQSLRKQGLSLLSSRSQWRLNRSTTTSQELQDFCLHMQFMDQAGVPLLDALRDAQSNTKNLGPTLADIIQQIKEGQLLSEAISSHPQTFPPLFAPILLLSEQSGRLWEGFKTLHEHLTWVDGNKQQLAKSLQYPAIILGLVCIALYLMTTYVIPQMQDLVLMGGTQIPYMSQVLLASNQVLITGMPYVLLLASASFLTFLGLRVMSDSQKLIQDRWLLKLPLLGGLFLKRDVTVFFHMFHVCLAAHVDLLDSLGFAKQAMKNTWLQNRVDHINKSVRDGTTLSQALSQADMFSPSALRMVQVGEVTGQLTQLLSVLEQQQARELKIKIERALTYLQPTLLGIIGLILAWIVLGIFYPMYDQMLVMEGL